ncbi:MAG: hypothetical protein GC150_05770 [Rhizobiales bacterium]|nr:hypothetical protein [Hyphomicrobiales bacterium]
MTKPSKLGAPRMGTFVPPAITIRPEQVLRVHGYRDLEKVRPDVVDAARQQVARARGLLDAEIHYRRLAVEELDGDGLRLEGGITFASEAFRRYCAGCDEGLAFVLTTGDRLDEMVRGHIDNFELIEALFLESYGWLAVEAVTRLFSKHLRTELAAEGCRIGMRMGPGYSYKIGARTISWPLEQQRELFKAFEGMSIPVTLMESCAMKPKLSRSGFYGVWCDSDDDAAVPGRQASEVDG